jgi:hypothetical protein
MTNKQLLIARLAEESGMTQYVAANNKYLERFVMALVQECIDPIETYKISVGNSAAGEMACEWTYDALKDIRDEIKEKFSIE